MHEIGLLNNVNQSVKKINDLENKTSVFRCSKRKEKGLTNKNIALYHLQIFHIHSI